MTFPSQSKFFKELSIQYTPVFYKDAEVLCPAQTHHCTCPDKTF